MEKQQKIDLVVRTFRKIEKSLDTLQDGTRYLQRHKAKLILAGGLGILLLGVWIAALVWSFRALTGQLFKTGNG